jgi:hypothetical protein
METMIKQRHELQDNTKNTVGKQWTHTQKKKLQENTEEWRKFCHMVETPMDDDDGIFG